MDTAELKGLLDKATKGPWNTWRDPLSSTWRIDREMLDNSIIVGMASRDYNAELICALRNNAEELIAAAERNGVLEAALRDSDCYTFGSVGRCIDNDRCTCGLKTIIAARQALGSAK